MYVHQPGIEQWWAAPIVGAAFVSIFVNSCFSMAQKDLVTKNEDAWPTLIMFGALTLGFTMAMVMVLLKKGAIEVAPNDYPMAAIMLETTVCTLWFGWVAFLWNNPKFQELVARWRMPAVEEEYEGGDDYHEQPYDYSPHPIAPQSYDHYDGGAHE
jgi:hypothetical protein